MKKKTPKEFAEEMEHIKNEYGFDKEMAHSCADDLMCEILRSLGYKEGVKIFDSMDKWYA